MGKKEVMSESEGAVKKNGNGFKIKDQVTDLTLTIVEAKKERDEGSAAKYQSERVKVLETIEKADRAEWERLAKLKAGKETKFTKMADRFSKKAAASKPAKNPLGMIMDVAKQKKAQLVKQEKEMRTTMVVSKAKSEFKSFAEGEEIDEEESVSEAGQDEEEEEDIPDEQTFLTKEITMEDIKRFKAKMKSVSQIMIEGDDIDMGSESDVSDTSQIRTSLVLQRTWSDYGDEIKVDKGTKLTKWTPSGRVSQRLTFKDRGKKSMSKKKKSHRKKFKEDEKNDKKLTKTESQIRLQEAFEASSKDGKHFVPTGPGDGGGAGVFYVDFSDDYKRCLKMAREKLEREEHLSELERKEMDWVEYLKENRNKPLSEKLLKLKLESPRLSPRSQSPRAFKKERKASIQSKSGQSSARQSPLPSVTSEDKSDGKTDAKGEKKSLKGKLGIGKKGPGGAKGVEYDAMGSKWNKAMWDNMENYWRMVMSKEEFIITPGCYDRQLDCDYRFSNETVTYDQLEDAREKCMDWILLNKEHFSL